MQPNPFSLAGRTALVTGAGRGIGFALATALLQAGARVVINGRSRAALEAAATDLRKHGGEVDIAVFDVTDAAQVNAGIAAIEASVAPVDILVNNAGIQRRAPL